jgi:release factor glutamine methyltransferase
MNTRVFSPNLTSELLVKSAIQETSTLDFDKEKYRLLDLGSGGCHVGVQVAKNLGLSQISSSDLDIDTLEVAANAAQESGINIDHRIGDLLTPWTGERFDLIIDDVSGVSRPIAEISPWFQGVPCSSGDCGTLLVQSVLQEANKYLADKGRIIFPIISLSAGHKIISAAKENFANVKLIQRKEWPLPKSMLEFKDIFREHKEKENIFYLEKFGLIVCYTEIYVAYN